MFAPAVHQMLFAHLHDALRGAIVTGALQPGQRVNEAEIAGQMRICRGPVRQAIRLPEQAGLLVSLLRGGTVVVTLSADDVEEVYTLPADLETRAIRCATSRLSEADLAELELLLDVMHAYSTAGDLPVLLDADIAFHRKIVKAAGWPQLQRVWESLHLRTLTPYTIHMLVRWSAAMQAECHKPMFNALRERDVQAAVVTIRQHILGVGSELIHLGPRGGESPGVRKEVQSWVPA